MPVINKTEPADISSGIQQTSSHRFDPLWLEKGGFVFKGEIKKKRNSVLTLALHQLLVNNWRFH